MTTRPPRRPVARDNEHALEKRVAAIRKGADAFETAQAEVEAARNKVGQARTQLEAAEADWARAMERAYGYLVSEHGKAKAERVFPKLTAKDAAEDEVDPAPVPGAPA